MSETIVLPRYEPLCKRCGHGPGVHTTGKCANFYRTLDGAHQAACDCKGWERDEAWPPPSVVQR